MHSSDKTVVDKVTFEIGKLKIHKYNTSSTLQSVAELCFQITETIYSCNILSYVEDLIDIAPSVL